MWTYHRFHHSSIINLGLARLKNFNYKVFTYNNTIFLSGRKMFFFSTSFHCIKAYIYVSLKEPCPDIKHSIHIFLLNPYALKCWISFNQQSTENSAARYSHWIPWETTSTILTTKMSPECWLIRPYSFLPCDKYIYYLFSFGFHNSYTVNIPTWRQNM